MFHICKDTWRIYEVEHKKMFYSYFTKYFQNILWNKQFQEGFCQKFLSFHNTILNSTSAFCLNFIFVSLFQSRSTCNKETFAENKISNWIFYIIMNHRYRLGKTKVTSIWTHCALLKGKFWCLQTMTTVPNPIHTFMLRRLFSETWVAFSSCFCFISLQIPREYVTT